MVRFLFVTFISQNKWALCERWCSWVWSCWCWLKWTHLWACEVDAVLQVCACMYVCVWCVCPSVVTELQTQSSGWLSVCKLIAPQLFSLMAEWYLLSTHCVLGSGLLSGISWSPQSSYVSLFMQLLKSSPHQDLNLLTFSRVNFCLMSPQRMFVKMLIDGEPGVKGTCAGGRCRRPSVGMEGRDAQPAWGLGRNGSKKCILKISHLWGS